MLLRNEDGDENSRFIRPTDDGYQILYGGVWWDEAPQDGETDWYLAQWETIGEHKPDKEQLPSLYDEVETDKMAISVNRDDLISTEQETEQDEMDLDFTARMDLEAEEQTEINRLKYGGERTSYDEFASSIDINTDSIRFRHAGSSLLKAERDRATRRTEA